MKIEKIILINEKLQRKKERWQKTVVNKKMEQKMERKLESHIKGIKRHFREKERAAVSW